MVEVLQSCEAIDDQFLQKTIQFMSSNTVKITSKFSVFFTRISTDNMWIASFGMKATSVFGDIATCKSGSQLDKATTSVYYNAQSKRLERIER